MSSILRPSTPPLALISSTYIMAPLEAGSPNSAGGPDSGIGMPTLMGFWAWAATGTARIATVNKISQVRRCMVVSLVVTTRKGREWFGEPGTGTSRP